MNKKLLLFTLAIAGAMTTFAQKKVNGTMYAEHPAIKVVDEFIAANIKGDSAKIASFLTEDFKGYNGTSTTYNDKGTGKAAFVKSALRYSKELDYFDVVNPPGASTDAVEYKTADNKEEIWVQTWKVLKGVHKATGVKIDAAAHRMYRLTKDNKINMIITYANGKVIDEVIASFDTRTNGKIYNHHDNINTVRKSMYAFEKGDVDKALSYYNDDAQFSNINTEYGKVFTKEETRKDWNKFLTDFEIKSIEVIGYPDYLEYEMDNGREVLSWWKFNLVRKKDKKVIVLPIHLSTSFDEKGKIVGEVEYYSDALLSK